MLKNRNALIVILIILLVLGAFYWFQYRPSEIRKECAKYAKDTKAEGIKGIDNYIKLQDFLYKDCLKAKGIEK